jgi:hypothetical protein
MAQANDASGKSTPLSGTDLALNLPTANATNVTTDAADTARLTHIANHLVSHPLALEEGATLNCIAVSQVVVKHGRITVPPALSVAFNGFSRAPAPGYGSSDTKGNSPVFSRMNPPPHWPETLALLSRPATSAVHLLRGGWRDVPPESRWWDLALGGEVEERRRVNMERLHGLRTGMDGAVECFSWS